MLPIVLRIQLIIFVLCFIILIVKTINKNILLLKYALVWIFSGIAMLIAIIFPSIIEYTSKLLKFKYASNMIFLLCFIILLFITFSLTVIISKHSIKIKKIIQLIAIENYENKKE